MSIAFTIRRLTREDAEVYRDFGLAVIQQIPSAFVVTAEEWQANPVDWFKDRLVPSIKPRTSF
jgi:hypothetical protein